MSMMYIEYLLFSVVQSFCLVMVVTKAIEKETTQDQRKLKIATSAISVYASRLMHLKMKAVDTTNL